MLGEWSVPGVMSMLMLTSKSWTEKRSVLDKVSVASVTSAEMLSAGGFATATDGNGPASATDDTC